MKKTSQKSARNPFRNLSVHTNLAFKDRISKSYFIFFLQVIRKKKKNFQKNTSGLLSSDLAKNLKTFFLTYESIPLKNRTSHMHEVKHKHVVGLWP